jgi:hemerythrin
MSNLTWDEQHSVGNIELDSQHRKLIQLYNEFVAALRRKDPRETLDDLLSQIVDNIDVHFTSEENYMNKHDYPDLMDHKEEHDKFLIEFNKLRVKFSQNDHAYGMALTEFLKNWFKSHFMENDRKFAKYINGANIKSNLLN